MIVGLAWATPDEARAAEVRPPPPVPASGLQFLGLYDAKLTVSDLATTNPLVNGQVLGTLGGSNATTLEADPGLYTEQRVGAFFRYTPKVMGDRATLTAAFEVDFAWGDSSYSIGGNTGGAVGADQVNLQTRRLHARFRLWEGTSTVVGLQFVGDGVADPERARLDDLARAGGKLFFFGTEAAGVSVYGKALRGEAQWRLGGYTLAEQALAEPDDVTLWMADGAWHAAYATHVGAHFWYLRDRAGGTAGALGSGPTSALSTMQGGPAFGLGNPQPETHAALAWAVLDAGHNAALDRGRFGVTGMAAASFGRVYVIEQPDIPVFGVLADAEARYRWAPGGGSVLRGEVLYSTGDPELAAEGHPGETYSGIVTGNTYGIAAATNLTHGCLLLLPDPTSVNRQVAVNYDVSGAGAGLFAATGQVGYDVIPNRLTVAAGGGWAQPTTVGDGTAELNARIVGKPLPLVTWGLAGAWLSRPLADTGLHPWMVYTSLNWVVI